MPATVWTALSTNEAACLAPLSQRQVAQGAQLDNSWASLDIFRYYNIIGIIETPTALSALAALAHETRLNVFRLLVRAGPEGLTAGAVGERLKIPGATLSFHLKELRNAGMVRCRRDGRSLIYSPDFAAMSTLLEFLTENCCEGSSCTPRV